MCYVSLVPAGLLWYNVQGLFPAMRLQLPTVAVLVGVRNTGRVIISRFSLPRIDSSCRIRAANLVRVRLILDRAATVDA